MNITLKVAFRNLFRQKRRTLLLGIGIGFSMMILFIVDALVGGISDKILNQIIVNSFGHLQINAVERTGITPGRIGLIRDKEEMMQIVSNTFKGYQFEIRENSSIFIRAIGNGAGEMGMVIGVPPTPDFLKYLKSLTLVSGNIDDMTSDTIENPVVVYSAKAESLGVTVNDTIRIKMHTVYGQSQTARMTVVAIVKSDNAFMDMMFWGRLDDIKKMSDIKPYEAQSMNVAFKKLRNPMLTLAMADRLHDAMKPQTLFINGTVSSGGLRSPAFLCAYPTNTDSMSRVAGMTGLDEALMAGQTNGTRVVFLGSALARKLGVRTGSTVDFSYRTRYDGTYDAGKYRVAGVMTGTNFQDLAMMLDAEMYDFCFDNYYAAVTNAPAVDAPLAQNWHLMDRTATSKDYSDKWKAWNRTHWYGRTADVLSMQELAERFLTMANAIKGVTGIFVAILFFIIIIGVVNTLRMTIRERTREIGTIRSIGMKQTTVRSIFIAESVLLSLFASIGGIVAGWLIAFLVSLVKFNTQSGIALLLDNGHIHFVYSMGSTILYVILICFVTFLTAWLPSSKASRMSIANALRHYE